jgi:hypothetical protein
MEKDTTLGNPSKLNATHAGAGAMGWLRALIRCAIPGNQNPNSVFITKKDTNRANSSRTTATHANAFTMD